MIFLLACSLAIRVGAEKHIERHLRYKSSPDNPECDMVRPTLQCLTDSFGTIVTDLIGARPAVSVSSVRL